MSEFVEECRREWKRLRVPDPVANEMAADLEADLAEAEAEGDSAEQVLGSGAFDPRSFAASWAAARGVAAPPTEPAAPPTEPAVRPTDPAARPTEPALRPTDPTGPPTGVAAPPILLGERPPRRRVEWAVAAAAVIATLLVGLALLGVRSGSSSMAKPTPFSIPEAPTPPTPLGSFVVGPGFGPGDRLHGVGVVVLLLGLLFLILAVLYWSPWADQIRVSRRRSSIDDGGRRLH